MNQSYEFDEGIMEINNEQDENTKLIENIMDKQTKVAKDKFENEGNSIILQEDMTRPSLTLFTFLISPNL